MITVTKRDGRSVGYDSTRIENAILAAMKEVGDINSPLAIELAENITNYLNQQHTTSISVEHIQDLVENNLMTADCPKVAKAYILYRDKRSKARNSQSDEIITSIIGAEKNDITRENANMNADTPAGMMMKIASERSKEYVMEYLLSPKAVKAIKDNILHVHDMDYYTTKSLTCLQHPINQLLEGGFKAGHGESRPAKRIETASILGCISMETVQNRFCSL
jgi:ribonucleoside-triphosphate reductase